MVNLARIQDQLPWNLPYGTDFKASYVKHKDFQHALIHVVKATGKLAALVEDADHDRGDGFDCREVAKLLADLVICSCRMANTIPKGFIDLETAVLSRIKDKNGVTIT